MKFRKSDWQKEPGEQFQCFYIF